MRQLACVYNDKSGNRGASMQIITDLFARHEVKITFIDISTTREETLQSLQTGTYEAIIAAGGDGTVNYCAGLAVETGLPLSVLPTGTLNHFARAIGVTASLESAVVITVQAKTRQVDYCTVNTHVFVNNSNLGIYPRTVQKRDRLDMKIWKWPAMCIAFFSALFEQRTYDITVDADGSSNQLKTPLLFIGNNVYALEEMGVTSRETINKGFLFLYAVHTSNPFKLLWLAILSLFGLRKRSEDFSLVTDRPIAIRASEPKLSVSLDGEVIELATPLVYEMHAAGLQVYALDQES